MKNENSQKAVMSVYYDFGNNFYDLAQTINLKYYWIHGMMMEFEDTFIIDLIEEKESKNVMLLLYNHSRKQYTFTLMENFLEENKQVSHVGVHSASVDLYTARKGQILYASKHDAYIFHHIKQ